MKVIIEMAYEEYDLLNYLLKKRSEELDQLAQGTRHDDCRVYYERESNNAKALKKKLEKSYFKL